MEWVRGLRMQAEVSDGSMNVHVPVNLVSCVRAFTSELLSLPAEEEEGDLTVYVYVLCESYMWVLLKAAPCLWQSV